MNDNKLVRRSDIFIAELHGAFELLQGKHPVIILSCKKSMDNSDLINIVPITSTLNRNPANIHIGIESGLDHDSMVLCNQVRTVPRIDLLSKVGFVNAQKMDTILQAINNQFGVRNDNFEIIQKQRIEGMVNSIKELEKFKKKFNINDRELNDEIRIKISEFKIYCKLIDKDYTNFIEEEI